MEQQEWLTLRQLAERWQVSKDTIYNMINRGDPALPRFMRLGGRLRFALADVVEREQAAVQEAMAGGRR